MNNLNFEEGQINLIPCIYYVDFINLIFANYLKKNYEDITPRDFTYLANIFYHQNCSQKELADLLFVSEPNVTRIIKRLEKNELIVRTSDENNKSRNIINLTEKGKLIYFSIMKGIFGGEAKFFENYDEEDVEKFKKMLYDYLRYGITYL